MLLTGWGRYPAHTAQVHQPRTEASIRNILENEPNVIARGNGRAYGDSAINQGATIHTKHLNHLISFDSVNGEVIAEAGVQISDLISTFLHLGWFPLVTPGTKYVTIGGAIAADIHGKNHHKNGSFRNSVIWIDVMDGSGEITRCSQNYNSLLFDNTLGGMGLTGIIIRAALRLRPVETGWIKQKTITAPDLNTAMNAFENAKDSTYSVAWIDCLARGNALGRSLVMLGEHAALKDLPPEKLNKPYDTDVRGKYSVPMDFPKSILNQYSVRAFNALYYRMGKRKNEHNLVNWDSYFYPLDRILNWNRIYGRNGFAQFQCVLPLSQSEKGLTELLETISNQRSGSFLAVLKRLGPQKGCFSFPMEGYTLALDFPINPKALALLEILDQITVNRGGRFYLAKDSRMSADTLSTSDQRVDTFKANQKKLNATAKFRSAQSERLKI
ncbi:FAD-binding oxidoreductase [Planktomarina temperata]|nr:FAD-binding oxidoreductase [Planktomarina temperata]